MWFGYVTFGFVSDVLGRKRTYVAYLLLAAALLFTTCPSRTHGSCSSSAVRRVLRDRAISGFGAVTAEIYPTAIRATAQGFTYNIGRVVSAAPFTVGTLAQTHGSAQP